nr:pyridoxamine 5'-phosphate oxidase family protein [Pedococcus bigeumensis]
MSTRHTVKAPATKRGDMTHEDTTTAADVIKDVRVAMLTTVGGAGRLMSRPMATQEPFDGSAWFFVRSGSPVVTEVGATRRSG